EMLRNVVLVMSLSLAVLACKKKEEAPPAEAPPVEPAAEPAAAPEPTPEPTAAADGVIKFSVPHVPAKDGDPVVVEVPTVKVVSATFADPADLTGATAVLEIDLTSLSSGNTTRDEDLKQKYFEVANFPKATVTIKDVAKAGAEGAYKGNADVDVHGVKGTVPVEFQVVEATADSVKVKGTAKLSRMDFKVGTPNGKDNPTGEDVTVDLEATVKKG